jgi:hypothetical protein
MDGNWITHVTPSEQRRRDAGGFDIEFAGMFWSRDCLV